MVKFMLEHECILAIAEQLANTFRQPFEKAAGVAEWSNATDC